MNYILDSLTSLIFLRNALQLQVELQYDARFFCQEVQKMYRGLVFRRSGQNSSIGRSREI